MSNLCEIVEQAARPTLSLRTRTPVQGLPQAFGQAYSAIAQYLGELGEQPAGPPFAAYYNMDMENLDVEMGFPVSRRLPGRDDLQAGEMPAGRYAACLYTGPYDQMGPGAYEALSRFVAQSGYEATGVSYEVYLNDPSETPPQELQTQVLFPLRSASRQLGASYVECAGRPVKQGNLDRSALFPVDGAASWSKVARLACLAYRIRV